MKHLVILFTLAACSTTQTAAPITQIDTKPAIVSNQFVMAPVARPAPAASAPKPIVQDPKEKSGYINGQYYISSTRSLQLVGLVNINAVDLAVRVQELMRSKDIIQLIVNSPGGSVQTGMVLIAALQMAKASGITVDCVVVGAAYSMGFNVLDACSRVFVTPYATFLFHPIRTSISDRVRAIDMSLILQEIDKMDTVFKTSARHLTKLSEAEVRKNYYDETLWTPQDFIKARAKFFTVIDVVNNLPPEAINYPNRAAMEQMKINQIRVNKRPTLEME